MKKILFLVSLCLFVTAPVFAGKSDPTGVLFQVKGKVEYTKDGKKWSRVRRNKFLFDGYQIRTGSDGYGKITIKETGENYELSANSQISVTNDGIKASSGSVTEAEASGKLVASLIKKFDKSQSYTTVRRSAKKKEVKLDSVRELTLAKDYPYYVFDNLGDEFSYRVTVGDRTYDVPATTEQIVKVKIDPFVGLQKIDISALKDGQVVTTLGKYRSRGEEKDHTVSWVSGDDETRINKEIKDIQETYGDNAFMLGSYFEKQDMWVASMDEYRKYLQENPDEIEMTPYLFRVYKKLQLDETYQKELENWKRAMIE